jgi:sigma-E factor negative regulatory protein RseC
MIESLAVVVKTYEDKAECLKGPGGLCGSCNDKTDECVPEVFNKSKEILFVVKNTHNAKQGDVVRIGVPEKSVLLSSIVAYGIPLFGLILGAVCGHYYDQQVQIYSMLGSLLGLAIASLFSFIIAKIFVSCFWSPKMLGILPQKFICKTNQKSENQPIGKSIE